MRDHVALPLAFGIGYVRARVGQDHAQESAGLRGVARVSHVAAVGTEADERLGRQHGIAVLDQHGAVVVLNVHGLRRTALPVRQKIRRPSLVRQETVKLSLGTSTQRCVPPLNMAKPCFIALSALCCVTMQGEKVSGLPSRFAIMVSGICGAFFARFAMANLLGCEGMIANPALNDARALHSAERQATGV
jgi:hypothetical protein